MRNIPSSQIPVNSEMIACDLLRQIAQARIGSGLNKHREVLPRVDAGYPETKNAPVDLCFCCPRGGVLHAD